MIRYMKCPRCELNYIDGDKQEYCEVCLKEMKGIRTDSDELEEEEDAELPTELCPICGENMMRAGDTMCEECRKKAELEEEPDISEEDDDEWREYLDDDEGDLDDVEIDEEFDEEEAEEEEFEEEFDDEEDMEYVTGDEIYNIGDDEDDDEDSEEDDF